MRGLMTSGEFSRSERVLESGAFYRSARNRQDISFRMLEKLSEPAGLVCMNGAKPIKEHFFGAMVALLAPETA
jgi:hypothetical protein